MKQFYTHVLAIVFLVVNANAQTQTHMAFLTTETATWCTSCGTWGWQMQDNIVTEIKANAVCAELHFYSSDVIHSATATDIANNFPFSSSVPAWFLNGKNRTVYGQNGGVNTTNSQEALIAAADSTYNEPALAQSAYTSALTGNVLTVNTTTKFFDAASGDYYVAVYILENNVIAYQEGISNDAVHQNVLRASMSPSSFGELIASGSISANATYDHTFTYTLNNSWQVDKIWLATVIWKKTGSTYFYENAFTTNAKITGINDPVSQWLAFSVFPNPSFETSQLSITLTSQIQNLDISLVDVTGRTLAGIYDGALQPGDYKFTIHTRNMAPGIYFLSLISDGKSYAQRLIMVE